MLLKISMLTVIIIAGTAITASAEAPITEERGRMFMNDDKMVARILERIAQNDPTEAERLEQLREDNPGQFKEELREAVSAHRHQDNLQESARPQGRRRRSSHQNMRPMSKGQAGRAKERARGRLEYKEQELIGWLEKNEPEKAKELSELKAKDRGKYRRMISIEMKKYRGIIEAEKTNPELAKLLKKDLELKVQRNKLIKKIAASTNNDEKEALDEELEDVISDRFDVILKKKQMRYDDLAKRLEELKKKVKQSKSELDNFKDKKSEYISERAKSLLEGSSEFKWD